MTKLTQIEEARRRKARTQELCDGFKRGVDLSDFGCTLDANAYRPGRVIKKDNREIARTLDPKLD